MSSGPDPFSDENFVDRFVQRRREEDSVNASVDEPAILDRVRGHSPARMLELGCATGALTSVLSPLCGAVTAVDGSATMLERARETCSASNVTFINSRFEDYEPDDVFDLVVSSMSMHLVEDFHLLVRSVFRWLRPGGRFVFSQRHPMRTANPHGDFIREPVTGWIVSDYFIVGRRDYEWLGCDITYFHRTISDLCGGLLEAGFIIRDIDEPTPRCGRSTIRVAENFASPSVLLIEAEKPNG